MSLNEQKVKLYQALVPFSINMIDTGKGRPSSHLLAIGDQFEFDGVYVRYGDETGMARGLANVVGEWFSEVPKTKKKSLPHGSIDPVRKLDSVARRPAEDAQPIRDSARRVVVEAQEENVVSRTSNALPLGSNAESVVIETPTVGKRASREVVHEDQTVVTKTSYAPNETDVVSSSTSARRKKLEVVRNEETDQEVDTATPLARARSLPANLGASVVTSSTVITDDTVYEESGVVEDSSPVPAIAARTDIGSSTQTKQAGETRKAPVSRRASTAEVEDQGGVVVSRVSKVKLEQTNMEGIELKLTVGGVEEDIQTEATFSSSPEGIVMAEKATVGSGRTAAKSTKEASSDLGEPSPERSLDGKLTLGGKSWSALSWQMKIKCLAEVSDTKILDKVISISPTQKVRDAAAARIKELSAR